MKNIGTKNLETKRLVLRKFLPSDYQKAYENYCTDERVTKYMTWNPHKDINETKTLVEGWASRYNDNKFYCWLITLKGVDEAIGSISVVEINEEVVAYVVFAGFLLFRRWSVSNRSPLRI